MNFGDLLVAAPDPFGAGSCLGGGAQPPWPLAVWALPRVLYFNRPVDRVKSLCCSVVFKGFPDDAGDLFLPYGGQEALQLGTEEGGGFGVPLPFQTSQ